jgi:chemotaxis signal transduction protein
MTTSRLLILGWKVGDTLFGTEVGHVVHIVDDFQIQPVPRPAPGVLGLTQYDGTILPVLDLAQVLMGESGHQWESTTKYVVFNTESRFLAGRVDSVVRIFSTTTDDLVTWGEPPDHPAARYIRAQLYADGQTLWLVDLRRMARRKVETVRSMGLGA